MKKKKKILSKLYSKLLLNFVINLNFSFQILLSNEVILTHTEHVLPDDHCH